jgi:hypothetical protein
MTIVKLQPGDRVHLTTEDIDGVVVEVKTRTVVVRAPDRHGQIREMHVHPDDLERLPTTKEAVLEVSRAQPLPVMTFKVDPARWICLDDAHLRADRVDAWLTALRTEYREVGDGIEQSVEFESFHRRRVLTVSAITGHAVFHKMQNAWDAYKTRAERLDIPESRTLDILRVVHASGAARIDVEPAFAYAVVSVHAPPAEMPPFTASAKALLAGRSTAAGLQGGALLASDDDGHEVLFTRWAGREAAEAFAKDARNHVVLPPIQHLGDEAEAYEALGTVPA